MKCGRDYGYIMKSSRLSSCFGRIESTDKPSAQLPSNELFVGEYRTKEGEIRLNAGHLVLAESPLHSSDGFGAICAPCDDFRKQRVVEYGYGPSFINPAIVPDTRAGRRS